MKIKSSGRHARSQREPRFHNGRFAKISKAQMAAIAADGVDGTSTVTTRLPRSSPPSTTSPLTRFTSSTAISRASRGVPDQPQAGRQEWTGGANGSTSWELAFTGSGSCLCFGTGLALIGSGFALRRRRA